MARNVTFAEIERILEVTDRIGLDRERVTIPLRAESPGRISRVRGKTEIVVDADVPFDQWLASLEEKLGQ